MSLVIVSDDGQAQACVVQAKGMRAAMEDEHVLCLDEKGRLLGAIFDGHNGDAVAKLAAKRFEILADEKDWTLGTTLLHIHDCIGETGWQEGGACVVAFRLDGDRLEIANVGDAEAVRIQDDEVTSVLTEVHRLSNLDERSRVLRAGAAIGHTAEGAETYVVDPQRGVGLMPTRSLGDHGFEHVGIVCQPYETVVQLAPGGWLIAACDGLWDVVRPHELPYLFDTQGSVELAAHKLALAVLDRSPHDNLTVIALHRAGVTPRNPLIARPSRARAHASARSSFALRHTDQPAPAPQS